MKRAKRLTALLLVLGMVWLLASCGQEEQTPLTLRAALTGAPATLDPAFVTTATERTVSYHVFENLMKLSTGGTVCAEAASYVCTDNLDGTETYTFRLRGDIRWSDGQAVVAGDYVYAWQRLVDPETASPHSAILSMVAGYEEAAAGDTEALQVHAPDTRTLEVTLNGHCAYFLSAICTSPYTVPVRAEAVERGANWASNKATMLTNGAYSIRTWDSASLTAVETEGYYDAKRPGPEELDFVFTDSDAQGLALYEADEVDFAMGGTTLREREDATAAGVPMTGVVLINQMSTGLRQGTRQALSLSVERTALAASLGGDYVAADGLVPSGIQTSMGTLFRQENGALLDNDPTQYGARCEQASELLNSMFGGRTDYAAHNLLGTVTLLYESSPVFSRVALQLQTAWREKLGVEVTLVSVSPEELHQRLSDGDFTMALLQLTGDRNDASCFLDDFVSDAQENYCQYYANAYDMLLRAAGNAGISEARDAYLKDAERLLLESGYVIPLYTTERFRLLGERFSGVVGDGLGGCVFHNVVKIATPA